MSHDASDISDEDAILPAVGVLDELDSDIDFSDDDDPALQDYSEADEEWKRRQEETKGEGSEVVDSEVQGRGDYSTKDSFWEKLHAPQDPDRANLPEEEKMAISAKAAARDQAILAGKFISCPRFTIPRQGYEFKEGEFGFGYYETSEHVLQKESPWPPHAGASLRIGLYNFSAK